MINFIRNHYFKIGIGLVLLMLVINYFQIRELNSFRKESKIEIASDRDTAKRKLIDSLMNVTDSLNAELFIERVESGRHEMTRMEILSKYPAIVKEYEDFYMNQTE